MADDIDELLDEVESKFISPGPSVADENQAITSQSLCKKVNNVGGAEELNAAIHSICSIPEPVGPSPNPRSMQIDSESSRKCNVIFVGGSQNATNLSNRRIQRKPKHSSTSKANSKRYFAKPVFELSVKDLEAESARRKQKERVEILFEKKLAVVTDKMILDVRKFKRIKSDVWSNFGDVRLLISEEDAKRYNIDYHVIHLGEEEMLLCKTFVACVKCSAVFSYESHAYGTSTLRSHLKSCGKPRYNMKEKRVQMLRHKRYHAEIVPSSNADNESCDVDDNKLPVQEKMLKFRDQANQLQEQILLFFVSKLKSFETLKNREFKNLLQTFIQIGAVVGNLDLKNFLTSQIDLSDMLQREYSTCESAFKSEVTDQYGLAFSAEIWMDIVEKASYVSLSCHYTNNEGVYKSVVLLTSEFPYENKSHEDMTNLFSYCMRVMNIEHCQKLIVVDYSYNMVTAFEKDYKFIQCICYSVSRAVQTVINQLCVTENEEDPFALPSFASLINQCRSLVLHFKENKLQSNLPKHLTMCTSTCWKSTLEMLQSINDQWDHIADILIERGESESFAFDQELLSLVVDFLEIFKDGCEELASITSPTLNIVIPWLTRWKSHCLQNEESPFLAALKSHMSSAIDDEVVTRITIYHKLATMLDPRFKDLQFLSVEDQAEAQQQAILLLDQYKELTYPRDGNMPILAGSSFCNMNDYTSSEEIDNYLSEHFVMGRLDLDGENKFNPLKYWVQNKLNYPNLSKIALWLLSCPASAVRSNDAVLAANWMVTIKESEIPQKHMHTSMFVKSFKGL